MTAQLENNDEREIQLTVDDSDEHVSFSGFSDSEHPFERTISIPQYLRSSQPKETHLSNTVMKMMQKEFDEFNNKLISRATKIKKKNFNLPQKLRIALNELNP